MRCPSENDEVAALLVDYCAHRLNPAEIAMFDAHLRTCGSCQHLLRAQQALDEVLGAWEPAPIPADFNRRFWARVERENRRNRATRWLVSLQARWTPLSWWLVAQVVAACVLAAAALCIHPPNAPRHADEPSPAAAERVDVEQVERTLEDIETLPNSNPAPDPDSPRPI